MKASIPVQRIENPIVRLFTLGISSGFGLGFMPFAPGTWGSLLGIPFGLWLIQYPTWIAIIVCTVVFVIFSLLADRACKHWGQSDCQKIVSDEVLGQALTLLCLRHAVPLANFEVFSLYFRNTTILLIPPLHYVVIGFILFRILDVVKPYPAKNFDRQVGGFYVIADDVVAGLYGAVVLWGIARLKF